MALHIVKLCVGVATIEELASWQRDRVEEQQARGDCPRVFHATLQTPKRHAELLDGGSIYWVIKGVIQVRQRLVAFENGSRDDGTPCCHIVLDRELVPVRPVSRRAFQGWRYFSGDEVPKDLDAGGSGNRPDSIPPEMRRELIELGLI